MLTATIAALQGAQLDALGGVPASLHVAPERPGDRGQDHVVDGAAELVLHLLQVGERGAHHRETAVPSDLDVEGGVGGADPGAGARDASTRRASMAKVAST